ncbi:bifunctional adenosylcobinamide kinase/adenosylcobinamide-phosphate guanylyltransferase [Paenibacillus sp. Leaf72]|uniref:bifunctional adenosylcobinamide kinase/adenosylcobinamide-phosphate guanylyltransferase n=1 Tax=Paenibacillus sp. Leaf72 TaxID=1736234 RepID=UPI0006FCBADD|nr:bifunctional adenosylcobinamide kinase/adenosylcobinamide-phosphate guanylyltransferase [Paenibacillus sp. Leaf72]KQO04327.1 adenosylcobinamide kinase/adenosylcobinamide phosphate guanyltransferase [Paenibacillus sp. Leaf72]
MAMLVTGGTRSGKSLFAEQLAMRLGKKGIYIATSRIWDEEMAERVNRHQQSRGAGVFEWETVEEPLDLAELLEKQAQAAAAVASAGEQPPVVLVDCLTLWLTNALMAAEEQAGQPGKEADEQLHRQTEMLIEAIAAYPYPLVLVTNEVGAGIVPAYPMGRKFRDEAGRLNQRVAAVCDKVFLVTAGIPIELKAAAFRWEQL